LRMGPYQLLFRIDVEHGFFSDGLWRDVRFLPSQDTDALIHRMGLLPRRTDNGIEVYFDQDRKEALQLSLQDSGGRFSFGFRAFLDDRSAANYTDCLVGDSGTLPFFQSSKGVQEDGRIRLHRARQVGTKDLCALDVEDLSALLTDRDLIVSPGFAVQITVKPKRDQSLEDLLRAEPINYLIRFATRKTYWTYYLLGDFAVDTASIVDLDNDVGFEPPEPIALCDKRPALAFRSKVALPLRQHSTCRFQLRETGSGRNKVLIKRLPVAAATGLHRHLVKGKEVPVSEIYVNY